MCVSAFPVFAAVVKPSDLSGDRYNGSLFGYGMTTTEWKYENGDVVGRTYLKIIDTGYHVSARDTNNNVFIGLQKYGMTVNESVKDLKANSSNKKPYFPSTYTQSRYDGYIQTTVDGINGYVSIQASSYDYVRWAINLNGHNITTRIKHGIKETNGISFSDFTKARVFWVPMNSSRSYLEGKVANTNGNGKELNPASPAQNIKPMIEHISTCTGGGWQTNASQHWKICNTCGYVASAKANHSFTTTKAATCTAAGSKKCNTCGYIASIPALGHSYSSAWTSDNSNHWHKCTRCSATSGVAAHPWTYSNVTVSTHDKKCNTCGKTITKEAHKFVNNRCACGRYNQVTVSFNVNMPSGVINGPSPSAIAPITYTYGDKYLDGKYKVPTPSMLDHTFLGWYTAASGGTKIETSTAVTNVNAHTLYAHWAQQPMTVEDIYLDSIEVIEYAGIPEEEYRRLYEPEEDVPYGTTKVTAKITGTVPAHYQYIWEYQDSHGVWKPATAPLFNPMKLELEIPNAGRNLNNIKLLLSIKNNYNEVVESNECNIEVYYRPNSNTINVENQN